MANFEINRAMLYTRASSFPSNDLVPTDPSVVRLTHDSTSMTTPCCRRILVSDRSYSEWSFENVDTDMPADPPLHLPSNFHPATAKLFTKDVFQCVTGDIDLVHSPVRALTTLAGVLQLSDHRTYGREGKRLLYKCVPDDKYLPAFLIPYEVRIGFSKSLSNKFVVFRYASWTEKHPHGMLVETLGDVTSLEAFYEYQLYSKSLHDSITRLSQDARSSLNRLPLESYVTQIQQTFDCKTEDQFIFSIDPQNSLDFDDALSVQTLDKGWKVSVYIANVVFWLETLDLWNSLTNRVATIYLPDRRRPMLPTVLSDSLCSLQEHEDRFAFVCDMMVSSGGVITDTTFRQAHVRVAKNYRYEEASLLSLLDYQILLTITKHLDANCIDSHDLVAFWMIETNTQCAMHFAKHGLGIFRSVTFKPQEDPSTEMSDTCRRTIQLWSSNTSGQYVLMEKNTVLHHDVLKKSVYVHMTSPIRRLVDLLNQMMFMHRFLGIPLSASAQIFLDTWNRKMEYVNVSMRSIRKVQNECQLLFRCTKDPTLLERTHSGVVFDRIQRESGYFNYMVYIESLNLLSRVRSTKDLCNYDAVECKLLVFENEEKTLRKIRLCIV